MNQKFKRGDVVHIAADLGRSMSHFTNDKDVVILGSYADQFGGSNTKSYTVLFTDNGNKVSWYKEHQLTFIRHRGEELITKITERRKKRQEKEMDLNWIVENWKELRLKASGATMNKLMSLIGITNPWGNNGEGIDLYRHQIYTIKVLDAVLLTGSLEKVEQFIADFPKIDGHIFSSDFYK